MQTKILIFIPTLTMGGAEKVATILANEWSNVHRVSIVTYFDQPHFFDLSDRVTLHCMGFRVGRSLFSRGLDTAKALLKFRKIVRSESPDFVLSFMNKYNAFALAALIGTKIPVYVSERDSPTEILPKIREVARDLLYPLAAGVICQTSQGREFMESRARLKRVTVIPNPVFPVISQAERRPEKVVLGVGRFVEKKAMDHLIQAFAMTKSTEWSLVICGDGPLRAELEQLVESLGIKQRVKIAGQTQDLRPYYISAGVFGFSSKMEGFPNALAEAMASGLPCVSYDCPTGPSDLIQDGVNGRLIKLGALEDFANALDQIMRDDAVASKFSTAATQTRIELAPKTIVDRFLRFCLCSQVEKSIK